MKRGRTTAATGNSSSQDITLPSTSSVRTWLQDQQEKIAADYKRQWDSFEEKLSGLSLDILARIRQLFEPPKNQKHRMEPPNSPKGEPAGFQDSGRESPTKKQKLCHVKPAHESGNAASAPLLRNPAQLSASLATIALEEETTRAKTTTTETTALPKAQTTVAGAEAIPRTELNPQLFKSIGNLIEISRQQLMQSRSERPFLVPVLEEKIETEPTHISSSKIGAAIRELPELPSHETVVMHCHKPSEPHRSCNEAGSDIFSAAANARVASADHVDSRAIDDSISSASQATNVAPVAKLNLVSAKGLFSLQPPPPLFPTQSRAFPSILQSNSSHVNPFTDALLTAPLPPNPFTEPSRADQSVPAHVPSASAVPFVPLASFSLPWSDHQEKLKKAMSSLKKVPVEDEHPTLTENCVNLNTNAFPLALSAMLSSPEKLSKPPVSTRLSLAVSPAEEIASAVTGVSEQKVVATISLSEAVNGSQHMSLPSSQPSSGPRIARTTRAETAAAKAIAEEFFISHEAPPAFDDELLFSPIPRVEGGLGDPSPSLSSIVTSGTSAFESSSVLSAESISRDLAKPALPVSKLPMPRPLPAAKSAVVSKATALTGPASALAGPLLAAAVGQDNRTTEPRSSKSNLPILSSVDVPSFRNAVKPQSQAVKSLARPEGIKLSPAAKRVVHLNTTTAAATLKRPPSSSTLKPFVASGNSTNYHQARLLSAPKGSDIGQKKSTAASTTPQRAPPLPTAGSTKTVSTIGLLAPTLATTAQERSPFKKPMPLPKAAQESPQRSVISLPGITSEEDDDDDNDDDDSGDIGTGATGRDATTKRNKSMPLWVSSAILSKTLEMQSRVNPDGIFGAIQPIVIEEVFKSTAITKKFRPRSSSAHWTGSDKLTASEIYSYNQNMGYHPSSSTS